MGPGRPAPPPPIPGFSPASLPTGSPAASPLLPAPSAMAAAASPAPLHLPPLSREDARARPLPPLAPINGGAASRESAARPHLLAKGGGGHVGYGQGGGGRRLSVTAACSAGPGLHDTAVVAVTVLSVGVTTEVPRLRRLGVEGASHRPRFLPRHRRPLPCSQRPALG